MAKPAGGRRNTASRSAKQVTKRKRRESDPRVAAALEQAAREREELEARIAAEAENPVVGPARGAKLRMLVGGKDLSLPPIQARLPVPRQATPARTRLLVDGDGGRGWSLGQARSMLRQRYCLRHVVETTGFGTKWFSDIPVDQDGYGLGTEQWLESIDDSPVREFLSS